MPRRNPAQKKTPTSRKVIIAEIENTQSQFPVYWEYVTETTVMGTFKLSGETCRVIPDSQSARNVKGKTYSFVQLGAECGKDEKQRPIYRGRITLNNLNEEKISCWREKKAACQKSNAGPENDIPENLRSA